jgi:tRNA nucleotidyltransferase/poly(A) polymerase
MQEDFLRILRFFRFQGRLNSPTWDRETMDAVRRNAAGLQKISGERVWMEMEKILAQPRTRADVLERMNEAGVLAAIDMPTNRINMVNAVDGDDPVAALAAAINSTNDLDAVRRRWKFSTDAHARARFVIENRDGDLSDGALRRMLADPKIRSEHVFALLNSVGQGNKIPALRAWTPPEFPVTGNDLTAAGMRPGPQMGQTLASLRREWETSGFKLNREQLMRMV